MRPIAVFSRWVYLDPMVPELVHVLDVLMLAGVIVRGCQGQEEAMAIQVPSPREIAFGTEIPVHTAGKLFFSVPKQKSMARMRFASSTVRLFKTLGTCSTISGISA